MDSCEQDFRTQRQEKLVNLSAANHKDFFVSRSLW